MKIKLNSGVEYSVKWKHENHTNSDEATKAEKKSFTECIIENLTNPEIRGSAIAILSDKDSFVKDYGRKISLKRCMNKISLAKSTRKLFWKNYFQMINKPQYNDSKSY